MKILKMVITQDKNHIWGMEDDLGTPAKPRQGTMLRQDKVQQVNKAQGTMLTQGRNLTQ